MLALRGVIPALPTPFDESGRVVLEPLIRHVRAVIAAGVSGVWVAGGTACAPYLTLDERDEIVRLVIREVDGRIPVYVHVAAMTTADSVRLARAAAQAGASAVSAIPPIFYGTSTPAIIRFLAAIQEAAALPIVYYHVPGLTKVQLASGDLVEIARSVPHCIGIKFSDLDYWKAIEIKLDLPHVALMTGFEETLLGGLAMGVLDGGVGAAQNFIPEPLVKIFNAYAKGDLATAQDLHWKVARVIRVQGMFEFGPTTYAILNLLGAQMGAPRSPIQALDPSQVQKVRQALSACVSDAPFRERRLIESRDLLPPPASAPQ
ncbi:MAG: dihydrodipicolinate synthase family protein [Planctomycetota bacterium]